MIQGRNIPANIHLSSKRLKLIKKKYILVGMKKKLHYYYFVQLLFQILAFAQKYIKKKRRT